MAEARALTGQRYRIAAVVGDGALTSGMVWEGLNHAGDLKRDALVHL